MLHLQGTAPQTSEEQEETRPRCPHHWIIEPANGPFSTGVCQKCWEVRQFTNYIEREAWPTENRTAEPEPDAGAPPLDID